MDEDHSVAVSGASDTIPVQAGALKKGSYVVLKGKPCKIVDYSTSKTGKHGHAKAKIVGLDIFTGNKYEDVCPTSHNMEEPIVKKKEYTLMDIADDGFLSLIDESDNSVREDLRCPDGETGQKLRELFEEHGTAVATVQSAMGIEEVIAAKAAST